MKVTTGTFLSQAWENKKVGWRLPVQQQVGFTALRRSWKQEGLHFEDSVWLHETPRILLSFELYYCLPELLQLLLNSEQTGNFCVGAIHSKEEGYWNCRLPAGRDSESALLKLRHECWSFKSMWGIADVGGWNTVSSQISPFGTQAENTFNRNPAQNWMNSWC